MFLKIFHYQILALGQPREGLLVERENGWGEIAPLPGFSNENLNDVLQQLHAIKHGWKGNLLPSVAFGLEPLAQKPLSWPASALLMGSPQEILQRAEQMSDFTSAKVKVGNLSAQEAVQVVKELKSKFHLRVDVNGKWSLAQAKEFCSHFQPHDFDYIEDLGHDLPFPLASDFMESKNAKALIWKPTIRGIPQSQPNLVLSSAFESGIGLSNIVQLAQHLSLPKHPIGIGTYHYLSEDLLEEPLLFSNGMVHIPVLKPKREKLREINL